MTKDDFKESLWTDDVYASLSAGYEHKLATWQHWIDLILKLSVGALAIASLILSVVKHSGTADGWAIFVSVASLMAAIALNLIPVGSWGSEHLFAYRQWSELRKQIQAIEIREFGKKFDGAFILETYGQFKSEPAPRDAADAIARLNDRRSEIEHAEETNTVQWIMRRVEIEENRRRWGTDSHAATDKLIASRKAELAAVQKNRVAATV